jgi:energy-coupling factor transporter ATP-binding protein EcfA2
LQEHSNPFSTKYFQPGAIEYEFFGKEYWDSFTRSCRNSHGCSLIVGPHGTGKSTLLMTLKKRLENAEADISVTSLFLHDNGRSAQDFVRSLPSWKRADMLLLDGFEQLSLMRRFQVVAYACCYRKPVIATSHRPFPGCKVIWRTYVDQNTEQWVIQRLLGERDSTSVESALASQEWKESRTKHKQNLRESLFDMYDWWAKNDKPVS